MIIVSTSEARARLCELQALVAEGHEVWITKHGVPSARLVPVIPQQHKEKETP
jgi:prevent-host-death family protein